MKKITFALGLMLLLTACNQLPKSLNETSTQVEIAAYTPSEELNTTLANVSNELTTNLMRGDAKDDQTYEQAIIQMNKTQEKLATALEMYKNESQGKKISADLETIFNDFNTINNKLQMALMRGDAASAPTYDEFMISMTNIGDEFSGIYGDYEYRN